MEVILHKNFKKKFQKLPLKIKQQYFERVELFLKNKFDSSLNNHSVDPIYPGWRSINITGDYRVLFEEKSDNVVMFMRIDTHSELYK